MSQKPNKYIRRINAVDDFSGFMSVDVYAVLEAFNVTCPARQHAVKKLLCAGLRGAKDSTQDLEEARDSITRSIQLEMQRVRQNEEH
jgi:hypothetical protein